MLERKRWLKLTMGWVVKLGEQSQPVKTSRSHAVSRWNSESLPCRRRGLLGGCTEIPNGRLRTDLWETGENRSLRYWKPELSSPPPGLFHCGKRVQSTQKPSGRCPNVSWLDLSQSPGLFNKGKLKESRKTDTPGPAQLISLALWWQRNRRVQSVKEQQRAVEPEYNSANIWADNQSVLSHPSLTGSRVLCPLQGFYFYFTNFSICSPHTKSVLIFEFEKVRAHTGSL